MEGYHENDAGCDEGLQNFSLTKVQHETKGNFRIMRDLQTFDLLRRTAGQIYCTYLHRFRCPYPLWTVIEMHSLVPFQNVKCLKRKVTVDVIA